MPETKATLALIAHDGKKTDMLAFAIDYKEILAKYNVIATKNTGT